MASLRGRQKDCAPFARRKEMTERWLPVVGYEGLYSVSSAGRVRSEARVISGTSGYPRNCPAKFLKPYAGPSGHLCVGLWTDRQRKHRFVHQLVLLAFNGPRQDGQEVRHKNGIPTDNREDNLEWGTRKENMADKVKHGTAQRGERHPLAKLTADQVLQIRAAEYQHGIDAEFARRFGVRPSTIWAARTGSHWRHL